MSLFLLALGQFKVIFGIQDLILPVKTIMEVINGQKLKSLIFMAYLTGLCSWPQQ